MTKIYENRIYLYKFKINKKDFLKNKKKYNMAQTKKKISNPNKKGKRN